MKLKQLIPQGLKNYGKHLPVALWANLINFFPSRKLQLIGVTGTDGKTTTTWLIHHLLQKQGFKAGMISTITARLGDEEISTGFHVTSPSSLKLQKFLRAMVSEGIKYAVLEITSHALDQFRFANCHFKVGVLTNITHEHLDYHKTFTRYLNTKGKLFQRSETAVLNRDDSSYWKMRNLLGKKKILTYGIENKADLMAKDIKLKRSKMEFTLVWGKNAHQKKYRVKSCLLGKFNIYNQLAAVGAIISLGLPIGKAAQFLQSFSGAEGRLETIPNKKGLRVFVDFAHTPNGLKNALDSLRQLLPRGKKLIVIFGAAGLRDQEKRPMMGRIAAQLADYAVLTSEDPRTEDPRAIIKEIARGCREKGWRRIGKKKIAEARLKGGKGFFIISNRQEAINFAIRKLAAKGDWIIACGKGHEQSMCFGKTEYPWSEHEAVRIALRRRRKK